MDMHRLEVHGGRTRARRLTMHGQSCKDDIYALAIRDDELDQADISLLHVDEP